MNHQILVVEDNPVARKMIRVALESQGCSVLEAADGATALAQLDPPPDLVVQDVLLPDIDGIALRRMISEQPGCAEVPVIAVSGHSQLLDRSVAMEPGFTQRLRKPVDPWQLLEAVREILHASGPSAGQTRGRIVVVDDTAIQRKLTTLRLADAGYEVVEAGEQLRRDALRPAFGGTHT